MKPNLTVSSKVLFSTLVGLSGSVSFLSSSVLASGSVLSSSASEEPKPTGSPITREQLAWIMKHPTEPNFDPLRPLSGRWVRCSKTEIGEGSVQDRFSSSDHAHFTRTVLKASDEACKTIMSEERTTYVCESAAGDSLSCKIIKRELKATNGAWAAVKTAEADSVSAIKLSFIGLVKRVHAKKRRAKPSKSDLAKGVLTPDDRKLEIRLAPEGEPSESVRLEFVPSVPHAKKHMSNEAEL